MFSYGYIGNIILKKIKEISVNTFNINLTSKSVADDCYNHV